MTVQLLGKSSLLTMLDVFLLMCSIMLLKDI
jgi:hypothetical protein